MSTDNNIFDSLLNGLTRDDKVDLLHSIQDVREQQIEDKLHPRRRRRRGEDGLLEPLPE